MSVQIVRLPVRKFARVGRPFRRSASSERTSGSVSNAAAAAGLPGDVVEDALQLGALPRVALRRRRERVRCLGDCLRPLGDRLRCAEPVERVAEPVDQLGEPAGEVDGVAADVVERQDVLEEPLAVLGHRHADEHAVEPPAPGVGVDRVELVTAGGARRRGPSG